MTAQQEEEFVRIPTGGGQIGTLTNSATGTRSELVRIPAVLVVVISAALGPICRADDQLERRRERLLEQMRTLAEGTSVRFENGERQPEFVRSPVFRYDDQPRHFIDATMWVWTDAGRPVAFEKIEAMTFGSPRWGYCLTSLAFEPLLVEWSHGRVYHSTEPGVEFRELGDAPEVAPRNAARKRQVRELSREFSARILTDPREDNSEAMRLLPTPIFEYADPQTKLLQGAVFGFATSGTNPDLLIVLEARGEGRETRWKFAPVRMTIGAVTLDRRDRQIWDVPYLEPGDATFPTWTFFPTPRTVEAER